MGVGVGRGVFWRFSLVLTLKWSYFSKVHNMQKQLNTSIQRESISEIPYGSLSAAFFIYFYFFNRLIIHLRALIYPPPLALYGRPSCEAFQLNFKWAGSVLRFSSRGSAYLWARLFVFPSTLTLWARIVRMPSFQERPWAGSHTASIGLVSQWLPGWKYTIINLVFNIRAYDLYRNCFKCLSAVFCTVLDLHYLVCLWLLTN